MGHGVELRIDDRYANRRGLVNIKTALAVDYWCTELRCAAADLVKAVKAVGFLADDVAAYMKLMRTS